MNYTDKQLQLALAKMLPDLLCNGSPHGAAGIHWIPKVKIGCYHPVRESEWLNVCWLIEQTVDSVEYLELLFLSVGVKSLVNELSFDDLLKITNASWQQRAIALARVKGVEIV